MIKNDKRSSLKNKIVHLCFLMASEWVVLEAGHVTLKAMMIGHLL